MADLEKIVDDLSALTGAAALQADQTIERCDDLRAGRVLLAQDVAGFHPATHAVSGQGMDAVDQTAGQPRQRVQDRIKPEAWLAMSQGRTLFPQRRSQG